MLTGADPHARPAHGIRPESSPGSELHGAETGGHAAAERRDPADAGRKGGPSPAGDPAGFPNGVDDIVAIELKAVAAQANLLST
jgi:hypothetical protein